MITIENTCIVAENGQELVEHGTPLFPIACYYDDLKEGVVPWHWHEELELIYVREGTAVVRTDTGEVTLRPGEGVFFNSRVLHEAIDQGDALCRIQSIVFHARLVGGDSGSVFWQDYLLPIMENHAFRMLPLYPNDADGNLILKDFLTVMRECEAAKAGYEFRVRTLLSEIILTLRKLLPEEVRAVPQSVLRNEARLRTMLEYIRTHLSEELSVESIAQSAAVSKTECIRCFRNTLNTSPKRYVRQLRLHKAAGLLADTDLKIVEIGVECGFSEMSYFARAFHEQFGELPTDYRKRRKEAL